MEAALDHYYLNLAFRLAQENQGNTAPNPSVGAVVVRGDYLAGYGLHDHAGAPHAEVMALQRAGERARNATLYCTLEPCSHYGKTPPCVDMILQTGISRVVYSVRDRNPLVNGKGEAILRRSNVEVERIPLKAISHFYRPFFHTFDMGRPYLTAKAAITANGMIGPADGNSRWITNETSRAWAHRLRASCDGILVGANTVLVDQPRLTVRLEQIRREPVRVILDSSLKISPGGCSLLQHPGPVIVCCRAETLPKRQDEWKEVGVRVLPFTDLDGLLSSLLHAGLIRIMVEGGQGVFTWFHSKNVIDEYYLMMAPRLLEGRGSINLLAGQDQSLAQAHRLSADPPMELGGDLLLRLSPERSPAPQ